MHGDRYHKDLNKKLVDEARSAGLSIIEDRINRKGGVCRLDGEIIVVYDRNTTWKERNKLIIQALGLAGSGSSCEKNATESLD